mgnify:CR=1 FL=1
MSVCPFVFLWILPNAKCTKCSQWKTIEREVWSAAEIKNNKQRGTALFCASCRAGGRTKRSPNLFKCEGCQQELGRDQFDADTLKKAKGRGSPIVCVKCKSRESQILQTLAILDASYCPCSSTWRHSKACSFWRKNTVRVDRADLEWMLFRPKHRIPRVKEIDYSKSMAVLRE